MAAEDRKLRGIGYGHNNLEICYSIMLADYYVGNLCNKSCGHQMNLHNPSGDVRLMKRGL